MAFVGLLMVGNLMLAPVLARLGITPPWQPWFDSAAVAIHSLPPIHISSTDILLTSISLMLLGVSIHLVAASHRKH
jgi:hypothetical protein